MDRAAVGWQGRGSESGIHGVAKRTHVHAHSRTRVTRAQPHRTPHCRTRKQDCKCDDKNDDCDDECKKKKVRPSRSTHVATLHDSVCTRARHHAHDAHCQHTLQDTTACLAGSVAVMLWRALTFACAPRALWLAARQPGNTRQHTHVGMHTHVGHACMPCIHVPLHHEHSACP
jgi:hypothetical protein